MKPLELYFSIIIPVYNRPQEIDELLHSLTEQDYIEDFEIVIIEDGSTHKVKNIVEKYRYQLTIQYIEKENSGAGASRNLGMQHAKGNYCIILDSDVIVPKHYLSRVQGVLENKYTDAFGGPDTAHISFSNLQKAINYSMTAVLTTGGIRGKKKSIGKFQPRSFNMGLSKVAFYATNGFSTLAVGEDIDLTYRLWRKGFSTQLIEKAFVYHKRRSSISQFFKQTFSFGKARPMLNTMYPKTAKATYWFPSLFIIGFVIGLAIAVFGYWYLLLFYGVYSGLIFLDSLFQNKSGTVAFLSVLTTYTQFTGYGLGFIKSKLKDSYCKK